MKSFVIGYCLLLGSLQIAHAQSIKLGQLTIEDGLTQGMVHDILQDSFGFMWFATKDGLNRYDGYDFKLYSHTPSDSFSLSGHVVNTLLEDSFGRIWAGTHNQGLNILDRQTDRFYKLGYEAPTNQGLNSNRIFSIEQENDSIFWIGTGSGLCRLTVPPGSTLWENTNQASVNHNVRSYDIEPIPNSSLAKVTTCLSTVADSLFFGIANRLFRLHTDRYERWEEISPLVNAEEINVPFGFKTFIMTSDGYLLMPTDKEVKVYHQGKSWDIDLPDALIGYLSDLAVDEKDQVWGSSAGLFKLYPKRPAGQQLEVVFTTKSDFYTPTVYADRNGIIWIGTNGYGVRKYNPATTRFHSFMEGWSTRQLYADLKGRSWIWRPTSLSILNTETSVYELPPAFPSWVRRATWVINPKPDQFWFHYPIIEDKTALVKVNEQTQAYQSFEYTCKANPTSPMMMDTAANIWLSSSDGQLIIFHSDKEQFEYFPMQSWFPERHENAIITVFHYDEINQWVWAGTQYGLLRLKLTPDGGIAHKLFAFSLDDPNSINEDYILSICKRPMDTDLLWIGTKGGGINRFDTEREQFEAITTEEGLPNNVAYGILPDEEGFLWITTNRGLCKFHPEQKTFKNYSVEDGLQSNEFNTYSHDRAKDGRLLIGGVNGLHIFHPDEITQSSQPPTICLTGLNINNEHWQDVIQNDTSQALELVQSIQLEHDQDQLFFQFSVLDYAAPDNNRYRYQMIGLDDAPVEAGTRREVAYTNLIPGDYTFKVWGANNEDIWSPTAATLHVSISSPWWATNWAYLIYFLIIATILYAGYRFQITRDRLKTQLAYEQKEAERLAALDQMKSNFFSNITHEFRTPLTLILEPARRLSEQLKSKNQEKWAQLIVSNSERMLNLVNQLLDINRLEEGLMSMHLEKVDLNQLLEGILKDYEAAAHDKQIKLELRLQDQPLLRSVETDIEKVRKIVHNLLSNALKFTPPGGHISLSAGAGEKGDEAVVKVKDDGPGIAQKHQHRVFDRFYQVDDSNTRSSEGTGIGLALCQELSRKLGGSIHLESQLGSGAQFILRLPLVANNVQAKPSSPVKASTFHPKPETGTKAENKGLNILVVEDNEDLRRFLESILESAFNLETARDGIEGLQQATASLPDLIITDVMMPRMDGFEMMEKLKSDIRTSHIPVIMLTAKSALDSRLTGLKIGADAYLSKPFYSEELLAQIDNLLAQRERLQAHFLGTALNGSASPASEREHEFLQRVHTVIEDNLQDEQFAVEQLSQALLLSRSQLHRKLKALTGLPASAFLRNYRLQKAHALLQQPGASVADISFRVGFSSPQYFSTKFKETYGYSPSEAHEKG